MINWIKGKPKICIDICLVIYLGDYEFGRFDGEKWQIYFDGAGGGRWVPAQNTVEHYAKLNMP